MAVIPVELAGRSYDVRIGDGLMASLAAQSGDLLRKKAVPIVTDENVAQHWRTTVDQVLKGINWLRTQGVDFALVHRSYRCWVSWSS